MDNSAIAVVDHFLQNYGWTLLNPTEVLRRAEGWSGLAPQPDARQSLQTAILSVYSVALYQACSGVEGPDRREHGYGELMSFLQRIAARRYAAVCADASQSALERICRSFTQCQRPETFLAFALQKLRDAARAELRAQNRLDQHPLLDDDQSHIAETQPVATDPADTAVQEELRRQVAQCAAHFLQKHPRAATQLAALWMKYIDDFDEQAIAIRLNRTVAAVQVLRSRARAQLRQDTFWQQLAGDLDLLSAS